VPALGAGGPGLPEVSSEDSSNKSKNAITRERSRSVQGYVVTNFHLSSHGVWISFLGTGPMYY
jgi:hypothetical protein